MAFTIQSITEDGLRLSVIDPVETVTLSPSRPSTPVRSIRGAGARMFEPVALVTGEELDILIDLASRTPGELLYELQSLRKEFFE